MSVTDFLQLNNHKLFEKLREYLPKDVKKTQNVLALNDGMLYVWDFQDDCVLTLNVKEARIRDKLDVPYQVLLPTTPSRFSVKLLRVNSPNTLLVVAGTNGVLVFELPERCPPYGNFVNNKEVVYCRCHSLDERLLLSNPSIEVRQVRFHPGSVNSTHVMVLTSDNAMRLFEVANGSATALGVYSLGRRPKGIMPGTQKFFLGLFGETAIDFDFGPPEISQARDGGTTSDDDDVGILKNFRELTIRGTDLSDKYGELQWPVFFLDGLGAVYVITINLNDRTVPKAKGPLPVCPSCDQNYVNDACSILCQQSTPPVLCIATNNGTISHSIVLPTDADSDKVKRLKINRKHCDVPDRALYVFETLELELGLATTDTLSDYCCPIFLYANDSRSGHYFATHEAGVHSVTIPAIDTLAQFIKGHNDERVMEHLFNQSSSVDYVLCTKTTSSETNPVVGFSLFYDPTSTVTLLAQGQVISTVLLSANSLPCPEDFLPDGIDAFNSPLKKMLSEPFDLHIRKMLKRASSQPIMKLPHGAVRNQQECYDLLQRASRVLREEHFKFHDKAREEIEKRVKVLQMLKTYQTSEIRKIVREKQALQQKAEDLADKYENIKEQHDDLTKRCEKVLVHLNQKKKQPSEADIKFMDSLKKSQEKIKSFVAAIDRLTAQSRYQESKIDVWRAHHMQKTAGLGSIQSTPIKKNLQDMTNDITEMVDEVTVFKQQLGLI